MYAIARSAPIQLSSEEEEEEEFVEESEEEDSPHLTDSSGADREPSPPRGRAAVNDGSRKPGAMRASAPPTRSSGRSTRATADLKRHYMGDPESEVASPWSHLFVSRAEPCCAVAEAVETVVVTSPACPVHALGE